MDKLASINTVCGVLGTEDEHTVPEHILNELEMTRLTGHRGRDTPPAET